MKKIAVVLGALWLSSCVYAGSVSVWDERNQFVERFNSYPIEFFAQEPLLLKTDYITENSRRENELLTAYTGYSMLSTKTFRKDYMISDKVYAAMDGGMVGVGAPFMFKANEERSIIGQSRIDNEDFVLVPTDLESFVLLVRRDGSVYEFPGQIRHKRLVLLDDPVLPTPSNFHFKPVTVTQVESSKPEMGFDLRYDGINNGKMIFNYMTYDPNGGATGAFEVLTFPLKAGTYRINTIVLKVVSASREKIDYMILNY